MITLEATKQVADDSPDHICPVGAVRDNFTSKGLIEEVKYGCRVFQKNFDWFVRYNNQTQSFFDGMILLDEQSLEVA